MGQGDRDRMLTGKRAAAGQTLIGHHLQGVQVAGRGRRLAAGLLGRQVPRRANQQLPLVALALAKRLGDAKVGHLHHAVRADEQVGRLDVPVDQPDPVGGPNRHCGLPDDLQAPVQPQASLDGRR
jgi:hypothetical protein